MAVEPKVFEHVRAVLNGFDDKYLNNGKLKRNKIIEDLDAYDEQLMTALLSDQLIHQTYTKKLAGVEIFEVNQFIQMLEFKEYWEDSYTKYSNKIGLTAGGKFIDESEDVVLDFPFKDTVLKAGMSKEDLDKGETADEPFLNEVIAKPEIDELLEPKIFINSKKYDSFGSHDAKSISSKDSLIVKGNNLIVLRSIKNRFSNKVKLVYLDPPYNTKSAANTFSYNNSYNHSSWLTFMKNRLTVAKDMLTDDGFVVAAIDSNELFYLGVLMDEIFGINNRLSVLAVVHNPGGRQDEEFFPSAHENLIVFAKNKELAKLNNLPISNEKKKQYKLHDKYGNYKLRGFRRSGNNSLRTQRPKLYYPIYVNKVTHNVSIEDDGNSLALYPIDSNGTERCWRWGKDTFSEKKDKYIEVKDNNGSLDLYVKERESDYKGEKAKSLWEKPEYTGQNATHTLKKLFNKKVFTYPKSEFIMRDLLQVCTNPNDIVLDFFMGSATTQAVAMKMHRQFIGIEQMDYINTVSVPRLQKVIEGEQGGISKDVNWQGGGSFVYAELMEKNGGFVRDVEKAANTTELLAVFDRMKNTADFDFRVDLDKFEAELNTFESLADQKRELLRILDKNQLYYNYGNIDDANVRGLIADHDYQFNQSFYGNGGED